MVNKTLLSSLRKPRKGTSEQSRPKSNLSDLRREGDVRFEPTPSRNPSGGGGGQSSAFRTLHPNSLSLHLKDGQRERLGQGPVTHLRRARSKSTPSLERTRGWILGPNWSLCLGQRMEGRAFSSLGSKFQSESGRRSVGDCEMENGPWISWAFPNREDLSPDFRLRVHSRISPTPSTNEWKVTREVRQEVPRNRSLLRL
jgi:hypothetical protein